VVRKPLTQPTQSGLCAGNRIFLFVGIAHVQCQHAWECSLFDWWLIDHLTLNGERTNSLYPEMDSIYELTALHDGVNEMVLHTKPIAPEHMQVILADLLIDTVQIVSGAGSL